MSVRAYAIPDPTNNETARVAVDRDGVRVLDLSYQEAAAIRHERAVDVRVRSAVEQAMNARGEA